jgi:hypothetical protein
MNGDKPRDVMDLSLEELTAETSRALGPAERFAAEMKRLAEAERTPVYNGHTERELRAAFDAVCDPTNWKRPWSAKVHHSAVGLVLSAVEFYHADTPNILGIEPLTGLVVMEGRGYQAD